MPEELRLIPRSARVPSPTLRDMLAVVFRQRKLIVISFAAAFLAVALYGVIAPSYESEMKVLVRRGVWTLWSRPRRARASSNGKV